MLSIDRHPKAPHAAVPSEAVPLPTGADHRLIDVELRSENHPQAPHAAVPSEAVPLPTGADHRLIDDEPRSSPQGSARGGTIWGRATPYRSRPHVLVVVDLVGRLMIGASTWGQARG